MKTNKPRKNSKRRWSVKYKKSINCNNPKGFSQKQYCKRKKRGGKYLTEKNKLLQNAVSSGCSCSECYDPSQNFGMLLINKETSKEISENLKYHLENNIPLHENIFRIYSDSYYSLINEVRDLYDDNEILLSPIDRSLIETDIGKVIKLKSGRKIFLDSPFEIQNDFLSEAKYKNRNVNLNKPFRTPGAPKKFAVYVKDPKTGKVKVVRFGDPNLKIRSNDPKRAKSFRARHKCDQKKDRTTPGYWSCNVHRYRKQLGIKSKNPW